MAAGLGVGAFTDTTAVGSVAVVVVDDDLCDNAKATTTTIGRVMALAMIAARRVRESIAIPTEPTEPTAADRCG